MGNVKRGFAVEFVGDDGVVDGGRSVWIEECAEALRRDLKGEAWHDILWGCGGYGEITEFERSNGMFFINFDSDDDFCDGPVDFDFARPP